VESDDDHEDEGETDDEAEDEEEGTKESEIAPEDVAEAAKALEVMETLAPALGWDPENLRTAAKMLNSVNGAYPRADQDGSGQRQGEGQTHGMETAEVQEEGQQLAQEGPETA
jgi:hypothetical protein